jgi:hypothetical protein
MGLPWDKEERKEDTNAKKLFFHPNERPQEEKNGIKREIPLTLGQKWPITLSSMSLVRGG